MKSGTVRTLLAASAILVTAACGSDDDSGSAGTEAVATSAAAETEAPASSQVPASTEEADTTVAGGPTSSGGEASAGADAAEWEEIVANAEAEGEVTLYTFLVDERNAQFQEAWQQAYPEIALNIVRLVGNEAYPKLEAERTTGSAGADVFLNAGTDWAQSQIDIDPSFISPLVGPNVAAMDPEWVYDGHTLINQIGANVFGWNTALYPDGIATYEDLLAPELKGKIALPDIMSPSTADIYVAMERDLGPEYLEQLAAQEPLIYPTSVAIGQAIAAGEAWVTNYANLNVITPLQEQGAPIETAVPTLPSKAWGATFAYSIVGWSQHPNAAQVLVDFLATSEGSAPNAINAVSTVTDGLPGALDVNVDELNIYSGAPTPEGFEARWRSIFGR